VSAAKVSHLTDSMSNTTLTFHLSCVNYILKILHIEICNKTDLLKKKIELPGNDSVG
jgi:hypothetical protein